MSWSKERFAAIAQQSQVMHGNKHVLPVAVAIAERQGTVHTAPEVSYVVGNFLPPHRIHEGLRRLEAMGALKEMPYAGRPHARAYQTLNDPYWDYAQAFLAPGADMGARRG